MLADPAQVVYVRRYGESSIEYIVRCWTKTEDYWPAYYQLLEEIRNYYNEAGVEMCYNHLNVHIIEKKEEFRAKGVPVSWVMIDDGWSRTDREAETLIGLDADPERFPRGLSHTVDLLRERYGVRHVGVWAAFQGYWSGLEPNGQAVARIGAELLTVTSNGCLIPGPSRRQAMMFWATWLSLLRDMGIDCVKIDSQSSMSTMTRGVESYGEATIERHAALDRLVETEMGGAMINCMGMAPESYWHRPVSAVTRTSDDFLPHDPASLAEHLLQNAYCSPLMGELYRCDWDKIPLQKVEFLRRRQKNYYVSCMLFLS